MLPAEAVAYPARVDAAVIIVGDELLAGHVRDANAHHIAERVAHHGHRLRRVVIVSDDPEQIATELSAELAGPAELIFVCGGLGPTHDDRTMEGVARALGTPLAPCGPLAERIESLLSQAAAAGFSDAAFGNEGLRKMAMAPEGAEVLPTSVGVIPAVTVADARARVVILPGPPRELRAVFAESVEPRFLAGTGASVAREEITHPFPESTLAAKLTDLQERYPNIAIGSYPRADDTLLRFSGPEGEVIAAASDARLYLQELEASDEGRKLLDFMDRRRSGR
jgi:molybdenum cofactor synthesis domain-containing protein